MQGFKFDDTKTAENRFIFRDELDAVSTFHPIMVSHRAGHVYYLNSMALELAGFDRDTPDPFGGRLGRDPDTGELNGVVYERAIEHVRFQLIPSDTPEIPSRGSAHHLPDADRSRPDERSRCAGGPGRVRHLPGREGCRDLSMRVYALMYYPHFPSLREAGLKSGFGDDMLRLGGIKMVADGAIAARTAYLSEPYIPINDGDSDCDHGILAMSAEEIEENVMEMHRAGFQVCIHANGDLAIDMVLNAYEKAQATDPRPNPRHRIEHCTLVNPDILGKMHRLGTIATPFCTYVYHHGEKMPSTARNACNGCSPSAPSSITAWWALEPPTTRPGPSSRCWASRAA